MENGKWRMQLARKHRHTKLFTSPHKRGFIQMNGEWKMENEVSPQTQAFSIFHYPISAFRTVFRLFPIYP